MTDQTNCATEPNRPTTKRWGQRAVWLGLAITLTGALSYFLFFARFATWRDSPVLNVALVLLGTLFSLVGCWRVLGRARPWPGKAMASAGGVLAVGVACLFYYYLFILSYQLPATAEVPALQAAAPNWTLSDQNGKPVSLSDYHGRRVVLVFYRGHW